MVLSSVIKSKMEKSVYLKLFFLPQFCLISRTSLMIPNRCCDEMSILSAYSITFALLPASCLINDVIPIIAFIGVRISCDILDRKSVFALFAFSAVCKASVVMFFAFFSFYWTPPFPSLPASESHYFFFSYSAFCSARLRLEIL